MSPLKAMPLPLVGRVWITFCPFCCCCICCRFRSSCCSCCSAWYLRLSVDMCVISSVIFFFKASYSFLSISLFCWYSCFWASNSAVFCSSCLAASSRCARISFSSASYCTRNSWRTFVISSSASDLAWGGGPLEEWF